MASRTGREGNVRAYPCRKLVAGEQLAGGGTRPVVAASKGREAETEARETRRRVSVRGRREERGTGPRAGQKVGAEGPVWFGHYPSSLGPGLGAQTDNDSWAHYPFPLDDLPTPSHLGFSSVRPWIHLHSPCPKAELKQDHVVVQGLHPRGGRQAQHQGRLLAHHRWQGTPHSRISPPVPSFHYQIIEASVFPPIGPPPFNFDFPRDLKILPF